MLPRAAAAQSTTLPPTVQQPPAYCKGSSLDATGLLQIIHTIIAHGNLQDIPFIEKTLGTKLYALHFWDVNGQRVETSKPFEKSHPIAGGKLIPGEAVYNSDNLLGSPTKIFLSVFNKSSMLRIGESPADYSHPLRDCTRITAGDFIASFKNSSAWKLNLSIGGASSPEDAAVEFSNITSEENGSKFLLIIGFAVPPGSPFTQKELVTYVKISQSPS